MTHQNFSFATFALEISPFKKLHPRIHTNIRTEQTVTQDTFLPVPPFDSLLSLSFLMTLPREMYIITFVCAICERSFRFSARAGWCTCRLRGRQDSSAEQNAAAGKQRTHPLVRFQSKNLTLSLLVSKISVFTVMICIVPERAPLAPPRKALRAARADTRKGAFCVSRARAALTCSTLHFAGVTTNSWHRSLSQNSFQIIVAIISHLRQ